jgi:hypothetical protein
MKALPHPKTNAIIERINALQAASRYFIDSEKISESTRELRSIKHDIDALFKADARSAWEVTGAWKALIGDWEGVRDAFRKSLALGDSGTNRMNWVINCLTLGMFSAASSAYADAGKPEFGYFGRLYGFGVRAGAIEQTVRFAERAREMNIPWDESDMQEVAEANDILREAGVSDEDVSRHLDVAGVVLRRHRLRADIHPRVINAEGFFRGVTFAFPVPVSVSEAFEMNMELADEEAQAGVKKDVAFDVVFEAKAA